MFQDEDKQFKHTDDRALCILLTIDGHTVSKCAFHHVSFTMPILKIMSVRVFCLAYTH